LERATVVGEESEERAGKAQPDSMNAAPADGIPGAAGIGADSVSTTRSKRQVAKPRWREIEAIREKKALLAALEDPLSDDIDFDDEILDMHLREQGFVITADDDDTELEFVGSDDVDSSLDSDLDDDFGDSEGGEDDDPEAD